MMNTANDAHVASFVPSPRLLDTRSPTVLCVDDDPNISEALARVLYGHGIRVLRAFLGIQGFSQAITEKPDLIILDLAMPKGQGTEVLACLKQNRQTASIPVIILTGNSDPGLKQTVQNLGADGFFNKPMPVDALLDEIRRYIPVSV